MDVVCARDGAEQIACYAERSAVRQPLQADEQEGSPSGLPDGGEGSAIHAARVSVPHCFFRFAVFAPGPCCLVFGFVVSVVPIRRLRYVMALMV